MAITHTDSVPSLRGPRLLVPVGIASTATFASLTAALQDNAGTSDAHAFADLRPYKYVRVVGRTKTSDDSAAGPEVRAQYSTDGGSNFSYFNTTAGTGKSLFTSSASDPGPWVAIPDAAKKNNVVLRGVGFGGDAGASPVVTLLAFEFAS